MLSIMAPLPAAEDRPRFRVFSEPVDEDEDDEDVEDDDDEDVEAEWWSVEAAFLLPEAALAVFASAAPAAEVGAVGHVADDAFALCWA